MELFITSNLFLITETPKHFTTNSSIISIGDTMCYSCSERKLLPKEKLLGMEIRILVTPILRLPSFQLLGQKNYFTYKNWLKKRRKRISTLAYSTYIMTAVK